MGVLDSLDKKMPILVVDDFPSMRKIVKNALRALRFENVEEAEDGQVAFQKCKSGNFALIISDWNMPNMMGIDFLKAVRADERLKTTPFLMVTAESHKENVLEATNAGVSNYIVKPFTPDALQQKIEAIFTKK